MEDIELRGEQKCIWREGGRMKNESWENHWSQERDNWSMRGVEQIKIGLKNKSLKWVWDLSVLRKQLTNPHGDSNFQTTSSYLLFIISLVFLPPNTQSETTPPTHTEFLFMPHQCYSQTFTCFVPYISPFFFFFLFLLLSFAFTSKKLVS